MNCSRCRCQAKNLEHLVLECRDCSRFPRGSLRSYDNTIKAATLLLFGYGSRRGGNGNGIVTASKSQPRTGHTQTRRHTRRRTPAQTNQPTSHTRNQPPIRTCTEAHGVALRRAAARTARVVGELAHALRGGRQRELRTDSEPNLLRAAQNLPAADHRLAMEIDFTNRL